MCALQLDALPTAGVAMTRAVEELADRVAEGIRRSGPEPRARR